MLAVIVLARTLMLKPTAAANVAVQLDESERAVIYGDKLAKMIQKETISEPHQEDRSKFYEFHKVLEAEFPKADNRLKDRAKAEAKKLQCK